MTKIAATGELHGRSIEEWIGKNADARPPEHVRHRVLLRHERICHWTKVLIRPGDDWDADHVIALINGGENRESNLAPIRRGKAHNEKTAQDRAEADRVKHIQRKHYRKPPSRWSIEYHRVKALRQAQRNEEMDT